MRTRPQTPPDGMELTLYVPTGKPAFDIAARSAIVGTTMEDGDKRTVHAYYEGAIYGQAMDFEERIQHAAGGMAGRHATVAQGFFPAEGLHAVAVVRRSEKLRGWYVAQVMDAEALETWAGERVAVGGSRKLRERAAGMIFGRMPAHEQALIQARGKAGEDVVDLVLADI